jgi:hypothetical protein
VRLQAKTDDERKKKPCHRLSSTLVIACYRFPREAYRLLSLVTALSTRSVSLVIARHRTFHAKRIALYPRAMRVPLVIISALTRLSSLVIALYPREAYRLLSSQL